MSREGLSLLKLLVWEIKRDTRGFSDCEVNTVCSCLFLSLTIICQSSVCFKVLVLEMSVRCMGLPKQMPSPVFGAGSCLTLIRFLII